MMARALKRFTSCGGALRLTLAHGHLIPFVETFDVAANTRLGEFRDADSLTLGASSSAGCTLHFGGGGRGPTSL